jgi:hypothetical protein
VDRPKVVHIVQQQPISIGQLHWGGASAECTIVPFVGPREKHRPYVLPLHLSQVV